MKVYLSGIVASCVFISLAELLLPQGKLKKCCVSALSAVFALVVLFPMVKTRLTELNFNFGDTTEISADDGVCGLISDRLSETAEQDIKSELLKIDLVAEKVKVEFCRGEIKKISIYLSNAVFADESKHIDNNVIADYVCKELKLEREKVEVYV